MTADCKQCGSTDIYYGVVIISSGAKVVRLMCRSCGKNAIRPGFNFKASAFNLDELPIIDDYRENNPPCSVCDKSGTEYHHFAPRNVFGAEADRWPGAWLCVKHHREWHDRMSGYSYSSKGIE